MTSFANKINDSPVVFAPLEMVDRQLRQLSAPESTTQEQGKSLASSNLLRGEYQLRDLGSTIQNLPPHKPIDAPQRV
jgi:hypothetical protein